MLSRYFSALFLIVFMQTSVYAAECLSVFPSSYNQASNASEQLSNFPANNSANYLANGTTLPRGNNYYLGSTLGNKDELFVGEIGGGETTARLFFRTAVAWQNVKINESGNPEDLIIVVDGSLSITGGQTLINAIIYVKGSLTITGGAIINGAVTSVGSGSGAANYNTSYINNADFDGMCDGSVVTQPITEYRFDEASYDGSNDEVIDSIGGFHGRAISTQPAVGKVCNAADLSSYGTSDYLILDEDILDSKNDFTVSLWANTGKTSNQSVLSGAGSGSSNELIFWFTNSSNFRPYLKGSFNGQVPITSIADNNWHHLVWTRTGDQNCFYRDNVLQGCRTLSASALNIQSLILGQEQDSIGGGFSASQGWEGQIDELLVFDSAISTADIDQIYTNQNAGLGYDGSSRTCPPIPDPVPIAEYRFDETSYSETANEVIDSIGSFHGVTSDVQPDSGMLCNAADLTATGIDDFITLNNSVLDNKNNFSISVWAKTSKTSNQAILSGAGSGSSNELIYWFTNSSNFIPYLKGTYNGQVSINSIADDNWHHLVWNRSGTQNCLYVDKVLQGCRTLSSSILNIDSLILGQEQDSIGGNFDASQAWKGLLDELLIFDGAISESQIETIYDNYKGGLGYDGATRTCPVVSLLANYQMEEASWSGDANEVVDQTGNYNATAINGPLTADDTPAISGNPGTCSYGSFDGVNDYIALPNSFDNLQDSFTITAWINPSNVNSGSRIFVDDENNSQGFGFSLGDPGNGKLRFYSRGVNPISVDTENSISPNTWTFVTAVHDSINKTRQIYINGVAQTITGGSTSNTYTGNWGVDTGPASIGGETDSGETNNRFTGNMDEVRVYQGALSAGQIAEIYGETHPCVIPTIDHYQIIHDGNGLTCEPETVTIQACTNAYDGKCTLSTDAVTLDVVATLPPDITPVVTNNITFTGSTTTDIAYTTPESVVLSIDNPSIAPASATVCNDNSAGSCNLVFADAGFRFLNGNSGTFEVITSQVSGNTFPVRLQALYNNNGVCEGLFTGNVDVNLSQDNITPDNTNPGLNFEVNAVPIVKGSTPSSSVTLNFGSDSIATIPNPRYLDAGQIQLHASYSDAGVNLVGSSQPFWVAPHQLVITESTGTTQKAGVNFDFNVTAYNSLDTTPSNITTNYQQGELQLYAQRTAPTLLASVDGAFTYTGANSIFSTTSAAFIEDITLAAFSNGISTNQAKYSEVGQITVDIRDRDYGSVGLVVPSQSAVVLGRFTPDHFVQTVFNAGTLKSSCNIGATTFAYSGQLDEATLTEGTINYLANPIIEITAYDADDEVTKNYYEDSDGSSNDFMKMSANDITVLSPVTDNTTDGLDALKLHIIGDISNGTLSQNNLDASHVDFGNPLNAGVLHYKLSDNDHFYYQRTNNAFVANFDADFNLTVSSIIDGDSITATTLADVSNLSGVNIRFGRLIIENSFGPETENLPQVFKTQYYNGSTFVLNTDDQCSTYDVNKMTLSNISLAPTAKLGGVGSIVNGETKVLEITAPGAGTVGEMGVSYDSFDWLKYDWSNSNSLGNGPFIENPTAIATFGLFRGNDRIISWREVGN
jgi:MSHA biogenesis protein MshQ